VNVLENRQKLGLRLTKLSVKIEQKRDLVYYCA